ncbi:MAG: FAD-binding protein [Synergistaceae bacterium]|jgi:succinate dehydrogenase/fumarate reductase flavoprotein subunit|nr:FAD-binding protein [Synergistaceae bacterium]
MTDAKFGREDLSCDVLIIGGGVAGLTAAVSIKERAPEADVLIVEKQTCGYSGKANKGGGVLQYFDLSKIDPIQFVAFHANAIGCFLGDQGLMAKYVSMNNLMLGKLAEWGARLPKKPDGSWNVVPTGPMTAMIGVDLDITLKVRTTAERLGVRIIDKTTVTDLLTTNRKIAGATGFSILDGKFYTFGAKAVVLASGSQNYRVGSMWSSGRGDGIAAAYRAGAQLRNPEFGNFAQLVKVKSHEEVVFGENFMYNDKGEHVTKNFRERRESDISSTAIREWYTQMQAGSPIHLEIQSDGPSLFEMFDRPYGAKFWQLCHERSAVVDTDMEVCPMLIGEQSPVRVGHDMQTTIPGLFAIGDVSYCGSAAPGAVPAPPGRNRGSGILNAVFAGILCADGAATTAGGAASTTNLDQTQISESIGRVYAPLERAKGVTAKDVIREVQRAVGPMENSVYMNGERIAKAMEYVNKGKELSKMLKAKDFHDLLSCHEAEAMVLCAELQFLASDMRRESRGWFLREDYPETDNENWLKWITVTNVDGKPVFETEAVPIDKWPIKPTN